MNTSDLIDKIATEHGVTKVAAKAIVDTVFGSIVEAAVLGQEVNLPSFGKFKVQDKPAREGRNPSTGATIQIAASKKLVFQPGKALKDRLNA
ncbi:HU family DNA-binding protein [Asticcacaulis excentricus]|uniref:Histone family protein DNA-binding protein n=1 Tax=Asticcacaulis excentricus (strain ATCC 15261 / DSM 4724 / KCTC 12464 / NCIMB 9791 / VKM B-1370 / CB 48) TaxID=573065 RepID=E8RUR2_ASTEC|nr:HU family DNA-binding protein [Asticcacaulis excentricus]ADU14112.1 histone family protein DNA-binding protein [Asticcacaulis excentricus CB 48]